MKPVYIVDDDEMVLKALERKLKRLGFTEIHTFTTIQGLNEALVEDRPENPLLIADYHVGVKDGIQAMETVQQLMGYNDIIIVTGDFDINTHFDVLPKPFSDDSVLRQYVGV